MNKVTHTVIRNELIEAGATRREATDLALLATNLAQLKSDCSFKPSWLHSVVLLRRRRFTFAVSVLAAALLIVMVGVCLKAQSSLPGSKLHAVKQRSEDYVAWINPDFNKTIMMRRAQEVNDLVAAHASTNLILSTLNDYKSDVWTYNIHDAGVLQYCRNKLQTAAPNATPEVKDAISRTLGSLPIT